LPTDLKKFNQKTTYPQPTLKKIIYCYHHVEKTNPQPLQQPKNPQKASQTPNKPQKTTRKNVGAQKTPTTTITKKY
jgi:hypothetical protein